MQSQEGSPAVLHHAGHLYHKMLIKNCVLLMLGACSEGPGREGSVFHLYNLVLVSLGELES